MQYVVKVGSSSVGNVGQGDVQAVQGLAVEVAGLWGRGIFVVLLSSGAVAAGRAVGGSLLSPAAAAALGQPLVHRAWQDAFQAVGMRTAQVLVTDRDLATLGGLLRSLLQENIVPIVNGNDVLAAGGPVSDNDTLAAQVAVTIAADRLVLLTDQDGVWTADPRRFAEAAPIRRMSVADAHRLGACGATTGTGPSGRGGMATKVRAAAYAARHNVTTVIAHAKDSRVLTGIATGRAVGTWIDPAQADAPSSQPTFEDSDGPRESVARAATTGTGGTVGSSSWKTQRLGYAAAC